jgi:hypothetical protein
MLQVTTSGTRHQPNYGTPRDDEAERTKSGSAGKEHIRLKNERECLKSENEQRKNAHGKIDLDDQDGNKQQRLHLRVSRHIVT